MSIELSGRIKAIIFDLDGTLADTFPMIVAAWNAAVSPHTGKTYSDAEVISRFGIPDPQMIRRDLPGPAGDEADRVYHAEYARLHSKMVKPFAGVTEMLDALRKRQIPMGVMTGKGQRSAKITVEALGWKDTFGVVITGEDVARQKPDPAGVLLAAQRLGFQPSQCAFVGDSPVDIQAGKAAEMITIAAAWHPVYADEVRALKPDIWAKTPQEIVALA